MKHRIGFVGVGRMGSNLARRLKDSAYDVAVVYDSRKEEAQALAAEIGAVATSTLAEVTKNAEIIFTVVSDDSAQLSLFAGEGDSLLEECEGKIFVNCATLTPKVHVEVARRAAEHGAYTLEACMASSIPQARNGTLYLMCAGPEQVFERLRPLLEKLSSALKYIGPAGRAAEVKALVNMVMIINTAALAEGLGLGEALGLDLAMLREIFGQTGANSQVLKTDGEDMQLRAHECFFSAAHAAKDAGIAWGMGVEAGLSLPLSATAKLQFEKMTALGLGGLDKSGVAELTFRGRAAETSHPKEISFRTTSA